MFEWEELFPQLKQMQRYKVEEVIRWNSISTVLKAYDSKTEDFVSLKLINIDAKQEPEAILRLRETVKKIRRLRHRNICPIYDFIFINEIPIIVMEYFPSVLLSSIVKLTNIIPQHSKLTIAVKIIQALKNAHSNDIFHLSLGASNILITNNFEPIIVDFGLAGSCEIKLLSKHGSFKDELLYMSPEQLSGEKVDNRSDIYSYGFLLYELFTGKFPFEGDDIFSVTFNRMHDTPSSPTKVNKFFDKALEKIILKCLEKTPSKRYQNADLVLNDLLQVFSSAKDNGKKIRQKKKIIIVDDELIARKLLFEIMIKNGYDVIACKNGLEAVSLCIKEKPDLVCMDIIMPKLNGIVTAEILLSNPITCNIPIILISSKSSQKDLLHSQRIGIKDYIVKPFTEKDILQRIHYWLNN